MLVKLNTVLKTAIYGVESDDPQELLESQDSAMFQVFMEIRKHIDKYLVFGPCNSKVAAQAKDFMYNKSSRFFNITPAVLRAEGAVLSSAKMHELKIHSDQPKKRAFSLREMALDGLISATGTCETYAVLGAVLLSRQYDVEISLENIHSDLQHTYLKIHTLPHEYIFDFWSDVMVRHGDWMNWNQAVDYEFRYTKRSTFSLLAERVPLHALDNIALELHSSENLHRRSTFLQSINTTLWDILKDEPDDLIIKR